MLKTQKEKSPMLSRYSELPENYDSQNPWDSDLVFERQELAKSFTSLFRSSRKPFVLAVNGGWGSGKSLFLRMWHDHLQNEKQPCFIFNAWEHDHAGTPINAFFTAVRRQSQSKESVLTTTPQKLWGALCEKFPPILGKAGELATTALSDGAIPQEVATMAGVSIESMCTAFMQDDFRYSLRKELQATVKKLCATGQHAPLIIMVDELDRCRPDFAIALLEDIKHLFSVEGVVFVLAVEKEQLKKCINAAYGLNSKGAHTYLGKFIDMTLELPPPAPKAIFRLLLTSYPLCNPPNWHCESPDGSSPSPSFADLAETILEHFPLSARDLSQVMCQLSIIVHLPRIDLLAAITCIVLLGHMQSGALPEHGWKSIGFNRDNYALLKEKLLDVDMLFPGIFKPYRDAIRHKAYSNGNNNFLKTADGGKSQQIEGTIHFYTSHLYDFLSAQMLHSPDGDKWKEYVNSLLLFINKTSIG